MAEAIPHHNEPAWPPHDGPRGLPEEIRAGMSAAELRRIDVRGLPSNVVTELLIELAIALTDETHCGVGVDDRVRAVEAFCRGGFSKSAATLGDLIHKALQVNTRGAQGV